MISFDDLSEGVHLAGFDVFRRRRIEFEAVRFGAVARPSNANVLQRNNSLRLLVRRVLEIIKTPVVQYKPSPFPRLAPTTSFIQPSLFNRVEESEHKVFHLVFGYLKRLSFDAVVQVHD